MKSLRSKILAVAVGGLTLTAVAGVANGQNVNEQYRQWQRAQAIERRVCRDVHSRSDMYECQRVRAEVQREYNEYLQVSQQRGYRNDGRYNNNGYYNDGRYNNNGYYNNGRTVYNPSTGQSYRVYRNGQYYETNYRGYELLRQAVNSGYQQGYSQGQRDRQYRRGYNYYGNNIYSQGTYGYQSYVARDQYQYYFQQGFQRGYEDGYNNTFRYGSRSGNGFNILGNVLGTILNLASQ